jgi:thiamine biosynthesis lipoprotein
LIQKTFQAIGTEWRITLSDVSEEDGARVFERVVERIEFFDKTYSRFRADSIVTAMSQEVGVYELPDDARELIELYEDLYRITDGKFTPLIGQVLSDAGYDAEYSLVSKELTVPLPLAEAVAYEFPRLTIKQPSLLDFGAAGKGYLVDLIAVILNEENISSYTINAGGDIRIKSMSGEPVQIGLENPDNASQVIGVASIANGSICGSAGNRRAWGKYHHIIDPDTLESPRHIKALWVVAETAIVADALTTCLYFSPASLFSEYAFEYLIVRDNSIIEQSQNFPAELFTT